MLRTRVHCANLACSSRRLARFPVRASGNEKDFLKKFETPADKGQAKAAQGSGAPANRNPSSISGSYQNADYGVKPASAAQAGYGTPDYSTPQGATGGGGSANMGGGNDGGGGAGGGGGGSGSGDADDTQPPRKAALLTAILAILLFVGGVMGKVKGGSQKSLLFGGGSGAGLLTAAYMMTKRLSASAGVKLALFLCICVSAAMYKRAKDTEAFKGGKLGPTTGVLTLSSAYAVGYLIFCRNIIFGSALPP